MNDSHMYIHLYKRNWYFHTFSFALWFTQRTSFSTLHFEQYKENNFTYVTVCGFSIIAWRGKHSRCLCILVITGGWLRGIKIRQLCFTAIMFVWCYSFTKSAWGITNTDLTEWCNTLYYSSKWLKGSTFPWWIWFSSKSVNLLYNIN